MSACVDGPNRIEAGESVLDLQDQIDQILQLNHVLTHPLGGAHSCGLWPNKRLKCWGLNSHGQLGLGDTEDRGDSLNELGENLPYVDLGSGWEVQDYCVGGRTHLSYDSSNT